MLYIMYNMVQRLPAGIRRDLSGELREGGLHMQHIRRSGHGSSQESSVGGEPLASFNTMSLPTDVQVRSRIDAMSRW